MSRKIVQPLLILVTAIIVIAAAVLVTLLPQAGQRGSAAIGGAFELMDQNGQTVTETALHGAPSLVFFGYTHCPDVCPTALTEIGDLYKALGPDADKLNTFFITVDPERDTPELLKLYLESFDPHVKALTGPRDKIDAAMRAYRAFARKVPLEGDAYVMDHTALVYLMDKDGLFVASMNFDEPPEHNVARIRKLF